MGWKDWPYWLKGGIILFVITLILFIIVINIGWKGPLDSLIRAGAIVLFAGTAIGIILGWIVGIIIDKIKKK